VRVAAFGRAQNEADALVDIVKAFDDARVACCAAH
jgi:hypothetical protein